MTFREGGAFDHHTIFEQIKERLWNAVQVAREDGREVAPVDLEQLPRYEPAEGEGRAEGVARRKAEAEREGERERDVQPEEPPPGYEEAQAQAVGESLEERMRARAERGSESDEE
jgi:hypothetical protein